jgi:hypothetical protein
MMDTDKERTLTAPFTEITSVKGQWIKHKTYSWVKNAKDGKCRWKSAQERGRDLLGCVFM